MYLNKVQWLFKKIWYISGGVAFSALGVKCFLGVGCKKTQVINSLFDNFKEDNEVNNDEILSEML